MAAVRKQRFVARVSHSFVLGGGYELSGGGEFGVLAHFRRMKRQHDVFARYARFEQGVGDGTIRAVVLNPMISR